MLSAMDLIREAVPDAETIRIDSVDTSLVAVELLGPEPSVTVIDTLHVEATVRMPADPDEILVEIKRTTL